jgi:hypothetical protein
MKTKILSLILCITFALTLFAGCDIFNKEVELPIAEKNENIKKPEGAFKEVDKKPVAYGGLVSLRKNDLTLIIKGTEYTFIMSDNVKAAVEFFNKDENDLKIKKGTILQLVYEIKDGEYYATDLEIIEAN